MQLTPQVAAILDRSCMDCHSNKTRWPWYSNVVPASWFLVGHIGHARRRMNLTDWPDKVKVQDNNLMMMCNEVRHGDMPIGSYTWIHRSAKLSAEDVQAICDWTESERRRLAASPAGPPSGS